MNQTQTVIEFHVLVEQNIMQYENIYFNRDETYYVKDEMFNDRIPF